WELREILEVAIATRAAERRSEADLSDMQAAIRVMNQAIANGDDPVGPDAAFHDCLTLACHNPVLLDLIEDLSTLIESSRRDSLGRPGRPEASNDEHAEILQAVRERDTAGAAAAMQRHLINGRR